MADPKMVPESDLIALKESHSAALAKATETHESALETLKTEHTGFSGGLQSQIRTAQEELSRLRAANAQLEDAQTNHSSTAEELTGLKVELETAKKGLRAATETLETNIRGQLTGEFNIPEKALEGKNVEQLSVIREALLAVRSPDSRKFTAGGGTGGEPPRSPRQKIQAGLEGGDLQSM